MSKKIVAVNKKTGSKYTKCDCKKGVCRVSTGKGSSWLVNRKVVSLVK